MEDLYFGYDLSIFRVGPGSGRAEKIRLFPVEKIMPMTVPLDASGLNFWAEPGFGRVARTFYSVK
jgi:hypothetical protein